MSLERWGKDVTEVGGRKRLVGSLLASSLVVGALLASFAFASGRVRLPVAEKESVVTFAKVEPAKAPPIPVEPPKKVRSAPGRVAGPRAAAVSVPLVQPKSLPDEREIAGEEPARELPFGDGDVDGDPNGARGGGAEAKPEPPLQANEVTTPPFALARPMPPFPEEARRQAVEATILVRFVVESSGSVRDLRILEGHPLFDETVRTAIASWRFRPATLDGRVVAVVHRVRIPFRLRHV